MEQRTYRGDIDVEGLADALMARFDHGDLMAQRVRGQEGHLMVQIATRQWGWGAARSALSVGIAPVDGGVDFSFKLWYGLEIQQQIGQPLVSRLTPNG